jgi:hypothetical protein
MPAISVDQREHLVRLTREVLLEMRGMYLAAGASPLKHWDQIQDRMRAATRTSTTPSEWCSRLLRDLALGAPSSSLSRSMDALYIAVSEVKASEWLDLVEREAGYVMAMARLEAERRRGEREDLRREAEASDQIAAVEKEGQP